jgi:hypothetical protein
VTVDLHALAILRVAAGNAGSAGRRLASKLPGEREQCAERASLTKVGRIAALNCCPSVGHAAPAFQASGDVIAATGQAGAVPMTRISGSVLGADPGDGSEGRALRERIGLVLQDIAVEPYLTVRETIARNAGIFPVVLITIFGVLFHGGGRSSYFYGMSGLQHYVPTIAALSVLGSCYSQPAIVLSMRSQDGILKRVRATPLPAWAYFLGLLAHRIMISAIDVALITGIGALFGMPLPTHWPAIALALVLGAASFCALGVAVAYPEVPHVPTPAPMPTR